MLEASEVLAVGGILGDLGGKPVFTRTAPSGGGEVGALPANALLVDLEPVSGTVIGLDVVIGRPREVDETGTLCVSVRLVD